MNPDVKKVVLRNGSIASVVLFLYLLLSYFFSQDLLLNGTTSMGIILLCYIMAIISVLQVKMKNKGIMSFRDSFASFILTIAMAWGIYTLSTIVLCNIIDVEFGHYLSDQVVAKRTEMINNIPVSEEQKQIQIDALTGVYMYSAKNLSQGFVMFILFASVIGLLFAAVTKKKPSASSTLDDL